MQKLWLWAIGALLLAALLVAAVVTGLIDDYQEATLFLAAVAAIGGVAGAVIPLLGNRTTSQQLRELTAQQEQAASDIRRLAELTESSLEEARAQKPDPVVRFVVGKERESASGAIVTRKRFVRQLDIERIVSDERRAALATLPPQTAVEERPRLTGLSAALAGAISALDLGPITDEERRSFEQRVDAFAGELRTWLRAYERYRQETALLFPILLRFENGGRVPARGLRVSLRFPEGFAQAEEPSFAGDPPRRLRFQRRRFGLTALDRALLAPDYSRTLRPLAIPGRRNVSHPRFRKGSLIVELDIEKLRHGIPEASEEPIWLTIEQDGDYVIPWEIHAENLAEPVRGELGLQIITEAEEGPPITSLAELQALEPRADDEKG